MYHMDVNDLSLKPTGSALTILIFLFRKNFRLHLYCNEHNNNSYRNALARLRTREVEWLSRIVHVS